MKIGIVNIDQKYPNLALEKIAIWHSQKGDDVFRDPPQLEVFDKLYVSCIFSSNKNKCKEWEGKSQIGGSGYDLKKCLPTEIEEIKPHINWGFTTRGCIRKCDFCVVPQKEGKIKVVGDLLDLWDGKSKEITLLDNNILALPDQFYLVCEQAKNKDIRLDFNQGLDIRLLTDKMAQALNAIKHTSDLRFAWDNIVDENKIMNGIEILKRNKCKRAMFYVLVGFDSTIKDDLYRLRALKKLKQRAYCMRYETTRGQRIYNDLASWVNQPQFFTTMSFGKFRRCRKDRTLVGSQTTKKEASLF
jgi:hypothetical protein